MSQNGDDKPLPLRRRAESPFDFAYHKAAAEYELPETDDAEIIVEDAGSFFFTEGWFAGIHSRHKAIHELVEAAHKESASAHAMRIAHDDPSHDWLRLEAEWDKDCDALRAALAALKLNG